MCCSSTPTYGQRLLALALSSAEKALLCIYVRTVALWVTNMLFYCFFMLLFPTKKRNLALSVLNKWQDLTLVVFIILGLNGSFFHEYWSPG